MDPTNSLIYLYDSKTHTRRLIILTVFLWHALSILVASRVLANPDQSNVTGVCMA
jgi:hypothetical protein